MMAYLHTQIVYGGGDPNHVYHRRRQGSLLGQRHLCLFAGYGRARLSLQAITNLMGTLIGHECRVCGSVPIFYPTEND